MKGLGNNSSGYNSLFTAGSNALIEGNTKKREIGFEEYSKEYRDMQESKKNTATAFDTASSVAAMFPGVGTVIAGVLQGAKFISAGIMDADGDVKKAEDRFKNQKTQWGIEANELAGAQGRQAIGGFRAAPYGRNGMKLSKFSKSC